MPRGVTSPGKPARPRGLSRGSRYPSFLVRSFRPKRTKYCVTVFVINEGEKVRKQLVKMKRYAKQADIIIADGGSTDGSLEPADLKRQGVRALLTKTGPGKLSAQMRMAFAYALSEGYAGVVVVDGNGKDDISAIPRFIKALDEGYDHIQGSRFIKGGRAINTPASRYIGVRLLHAPLLSVAARYRHTDTTNGFRAYSRKLLVDERVDIFRDVFTAYELHYHLAVESARLGFRLTEIPVTRRYPGGQKAPTKISPLRGNLLVLQTLFQTVLGRYRSPKSKMRTRSEPTSKAR